MGKSKQSKIENRTRIIVAIIVIIVISLTIPCYLYLLSENENNGNVTDKPSNNSGDVVDNSNLIYKNELSSDNDLSDNKRLFGKWVSTHTEIYKNGKLSTKLINNDKYIIQVYKLDALDVCYMLDDGSDTKCMSMGYTFVNNKLSIGFNSLYLNTNSEISVDESNMTIKDVINDTMYTLLYLKKAD